MLTREFTEEEILEFKDAFTMFDLDGGGKSNLLLGAGVVGAAGPSRIDRRLVLSGSHAFFQSSGTIETHELLHVMTKLGEQPTEEEIQEMIEAVDQNGDGEIDFDEFLALMRLRMGEDGDDAEEHLRDVFNMFDADGSGLIDRDELRTLMKKLAQSLTEDEITAIMEEVDLDGDGEISFEEFKLLMVE